MRYKLLILEEAFFDMEDAIEFYDTPQTQQTFAKRLHEGLKKVGKNPLLFAIKYSKVRIYNLSPYKHQIHYRIIDKSVQIIAIFYGTSDPNSWLERSTTV